ncbi:MAG: endo-1,4-beta-xylanase [Pseudosphingobacterium sp.]|nr:endo-1,4-beta-xylanase [Olivibacter sp. UJ_SKK_5.1]MDX3912692.1 endo-1,4-beta-xylanase [Pseudosphingobacterium sp.]
MKRTILSICLLGPFVHACGTNPSNGNKSAESAPIEQRRIEKNIEDVAKKNKSISQKDEHIGLSDQIEESPKIEKLGSQTTTSLKNVYKNYFPIGAAILPRDIENPKIATFLKEQYSSVTAANHMKPTYLQPREGVFEWKQADLIANFAKSNGMKLRGHTLVWSQQMPKWMYRDGNKVASKQLLLNRLKKHITTVVARYKGVAYCWDVVNESIPYVLKKPLDSRIDSLFVITGEEFISKSFEYAHAADPKAKLFYNDNSFEWKEKRDQIFLYLKKLKEKGVPIHGVGLQAHWGIEGISKTYLQETIDMFASIGLEVQLTELDISIYPKKEYGRIMNARTLKNKSDVYSNDIQDKQAIVYKMIFDVCRRNKGKITGITLWSPYDWDNYLTKKLGKKNYPYLFDRNLKPKKVFESVVKF